MDPFTAPATPAAPATLAVMRPVAAAFDDEEVPLGRECANPALQIERRGLEDESCG